MMHLTRSVVCAYCERTQRVNGDRLVRRHGRYVTSAGEVKWCAGSGTKESGHQLAPLEAEQ